MPDERTDDRVERSRFGPNTWLLDELYARYLIDPSEVSEAWREFFEGYRPQGGDGRARERSPAPSTSPSAPSEARVPEGAEVRSLGGAGAVVARRMEESLGVPTATSIRTVPAKLLELNRRAINRALEHGPGGRVSLTHLIAYAIVRGLVDVPAMRRVFAMVDGRASVVEPPHVDLGIAVDVERGDGSRILLVPTIREAETLDFTAFVRTYDDLVRRAREGNLAPDELAGAIVTITNPGTLGTGGSVPRLMAGQSAIVGVGAVGYPAEFAGTDPRTLAELGVSSVVTLTSTYDHRVIQGAESGTFLGRVDELLRGDHGFYGTVFDALEMPHRPIHWTIDARPDDASGDEHKHARVLQLINNYRVRGHLIADLDPLATVPPETHPDLDPANLGFTIWDLDRTFPTGGLAGTERATLAEIWDLLRDAYCGTLAVEYMHIQEPEEKAWIQQQVEGRRDELGAQDRRLILQRLNGAEALERFLHTRYVGHKRFSLEGAESLIPIVDAILDRTADEGLAEVVMGMAHRGRINVLANVIGYSYAEIFRGFEGELDPRSVEGSGDVKYHLGATGKHTSPAGSGIALTLAPNPSHLESVDPVVEGIARAKQDALGEPIVLPLLIHGEAAFAGQGVVAETLNLSRLPGYRTGGTIHVIVNNQLGFTTPAAYARSTVYPSDLAKAVQAPILHVNGDDPEACVRAARLAFAYRQAFGKDVVIDLWCYRRWGHNEADEPSFTQPIMYRRIGELRSVRKRYMEVLVRRGDLSLEDAEQTLEEYTARLRAVSEETRGAEPEVPPIERSAPAPSPPNEPETAVDRELLDRVLEKLVAVPEGFHLHPKLERWLQRRASALQDGRVDWALAEALAFGSLIEDGVPIRLAGQDTRRGTFSQRHAVLVDQETGAEHFPLGRGAFVVDSLLSEFAALGFEYGYSVGRPEALVMWEAQFGDFVNGAQIVIDQYVVAAEDRWGQRSGLALLLPHGYEGQGPEHSSARLERFLELTAEDNIEVAVPSTAAQIFHLLRRQALREVRKPLIVLTPKSLLRLAAAAGTPEELTSGAFRPVLEDPARPPQPARVVLCQGKLFYELAERRSADRLEDLALVRLERCYPFPAGELREAIGAVDEVAWAQEEPENMGAGRFVLRNLRERVGVEAKLITRPESPSPATGSLTLHKQEQEELVDRVLTGKER